MRFVLVCITKDSIALCRTSRGAIKYLLTITQKAKNVHQYKHWIEEVAKHNVFKIDDYLLYNSEERPQVKVTLKKRRAGFGHCVVCVEFYWAIVQTIYVSNKEFEFASCGRDLRSIAEMMNNFHHERLSCLEG